MEEGPCRQERSVLSGDTGLGQEHRPCKMSGRAWEGDSEEEPSDLHAYVMTVWSTKHSQGSQWTPLGGGSVVRD